ncbi:ABC transporter D family member 2, chloroplastic-like protein [Drosera capensis]
MVVLPSCSFPSHPPPLTSNPNPRANPAPPSTLNRRRKIPKPKQKPSSVSFPQQTTDSSTRRNCADSSSSSSSVSVDPIEEGGGEGGKRKTPEIKTLLRRFWKVAAPYWSSEDKMQARWRLAAVFALTLGTTGISVGFNFLGRDFYNALANKDQEQFSKQLLYYLGAFAGGIPFFVLRDYARDTLSLRWRSWMTTYYMDRYLRNQTFYKIQSLSILDNPDQRIVDDLSSFTGTALSFSLTLFNALVDLISFSNILYGIYPPLFIVLLVYSLGGTTISIFLGKELVSLNFLQEKKEADFRYGLVRVRENAESIAFYGGEENEMQLLLQRFRNAYENLTRLLISSRNLEFFTNGYRYLIQILPAAVVAPMYFSGKIEFGVINQSVSAFNHILGDFSLIVYQFQALSAFSAVIDRLGEFDDVLDGNTSSNGMPNTEEKLQVSYCSMNPTLPDSNGYIGLIVPKKLVDIENLTLETPVGEVLVKNLSLEIKQNCHLLVTGPSGSGKTSLLRAMAELWTTGRGKITFYVSDSDISDSLEPEASSATIFSDSSSSNGKMKESGIYRHKNSRNIFFLPQKPYMVLGTLREQLLYPTWSNVPVTSGTKETGSPPFLMRLHSMGSTRSGMEKPTTDDLVKLLEDVRLGYLLSRFNGLDTTCEWSSVLSLGEQQRLAFARLLLSKPDLVLLDESTSALDEANESHLYHLIDSVGTTYISVGHRSSLFRYHKKVLKISPPNRASAERNWHVESISQETQSNAVSINS